MEKRLCCLISDASCLIVKDRRAAEEIRRVTLLAMLDGYNEYLTDLGSPAALIFANYILDEREHVAATRLEAIIETNRELRRMYYDENLFHIISRCTEYLSWENIKGGDRRAMLRYMMDRSTRILIPYDGRKRDDSDAVYAIDYLASANRYDEAVIIEV